jgi:ABC-type uncharacterized transport system permease subunit
MSTYTFWLPVGLYFVGWVLDFIRYWRDTPGGSHWGGGLLAIGWGAHTIFLVTRLLEDAFSLVNLLSGLAWLAIIAYYLVLRRFQGSIFGFIFPPFAVAALLVAGLVSPESLLPSERLAFSPSIAQNVLITHIVAVLAGHLLFALACLFSIVYLYQERQLKTKMRGLTGSTLPSLGALDNLNYKAIILGFFFLSVGILLGMLVSGLQNPPFQLFTWRRVIPLFTWLVYAAFLLEHSLQGRRGRFGAIWSIAGFVIVTSSLVAEMFFLLSRA